jgi:hypothetical protein
MNKKRWVKISAFVSIIVFFCLPSIISNFSEDLKIGTAQWALIQVAVALPIVLIWYFIRIKSDSNKVFSEIFYSKSFFIPFFGIISLPNILIPSIAILPKYSFNASIMIVVIYLIFDYWSFSIACDYLETALRDEYDDDNRNEALKELSIKHLLIIKLCTIVLTANLYMMYFYNKFNVIIFGLSMFMFAFACFHISTYWRQIARSQGSE